MLGQQVAADAKITVDRLAHSEQQRRVTILLHKPIGYVSGQAEDGHEPAAALFQASSRWRDDRSPERFSPSQLRGLAPAGRLDIDSTGLLVLTQDGRVARQLIGEDSALQKEYLVRVTLDRAVAGPDGDRLRSMDEEHRVSSDVKAAFSPRQLDLLRHGLSLDGRALKPARIEWQNPEQLRFILTEGRNRQIRRMCELVGLRVTGLKRVRIGGIMLGRLPVGQWRYLGSDERF